MPSVSSAWQQGGFTHADVINFLKSCQAASGGFGGGPLQLPHLAPTYAATAALVSLGGDEALDAVNRAAMLDFVCRLAVPPEHGGGFQVCEGVFPKVAAVFAQFAHFQGMLGSKTWREGFWLPPMCMYTFHLALACAPPSVHDNSLSTTS